MSEKYIPLYRKYRPKTLNEVVGQAHVKKALTNAITLSKISHAYLFTGPRGTGKTSIARILAKSLNCQKGPTVEPCGECPSCLDIANSVPIDVIEIDAASNRKVEDAQNILEKIQYVPVNGKFKIYIIDEVHMLTNHAFNALLKTLEEPPANVIFILATTEPQKVLETIISRCQRFDFRRITTEDIVSHLKNIAKLEKIKIEDDALFTIAKNAAGGMRDSLALLDQVSVLDSDSKITTEDINALLGRLSFDVLKSLVDSFLDSQPQAAIEKLDKIYNSGNEPTQILVNLLNYFKNMLIVKNCSDKALLQDLTQLNDAQISEIKSQIEDLDTHQIVFLLERTSYYIKEVKEANNQHLWLEIAVIDLANLAQNTSLIEIQERLSKLESSQPSVPSFSKSAAMPVQKMSQPAVQSPATQASQAPRTSQTSVPQESANAKKSSENNISSAVKEKSSEISDSSTNVTSQKNEAEEFSPMPKSVVQSSGDSVVGTDLSSSWVHFLELLHKRNMPTCAMVKQHAFPVEFSAQSVVLACKTEIYLKMLGSEAKKKVISEILSEYFASPIEKFQIRMAKGDEKPMTAPAGEKKNLVSGAGLKKEADSTLNVETPQSQSVSEDDDDLDEDLTAELASVQPLQIEKSNFMPSDQVNMVMKLFDGKIID